MIKKAAFPELREQAVALRRAGRSRREIKELLGITSGEILNEALKGEPPQPWNVRPNAKDAERAKARRSADLYRKIEGWAAAAMSAGRTMPAYPLHPFSP